MIHSDICIAGAGIIGLSLALELQARGHSVLVVDSRDPMQQASTAAAGMLAAADPHNPADLSALSQHSVSLYPGFLARIHTLTHIDVPFQTQRTLQALPGNPATLLSLQLQSELLLECSTTTLPHDSGFTLLAEHSIDPRQLAPALISAVAAASIRTLYRSPILSTSHVSGSVAVHTSTTSIQASHFIDCTGAWADSFDTDTSIQAIPIKGQMLVLTLPLDLQLKTVLRTEDLYIVPRTLGPGTGRAIIGATVEDVGFDWTVHPHAIESLRQRAIALVPALARATIADSWAGLRPSTPDRLPVLGPHPIRPHHWIASGHYRNGILLAPATAHVMADLVLGHASPLSLDAFSPSRPAIQPVSSIQ